MKKVAIILLSMAMVFCGVLAGCSKQDAGYTVKLPEYYSEEQPTENPNEAAKPEKETITYTFNGEELTLSYVDRSDYFGRHLLEYTNAEETVTVNCYADTGNIAFVSFDDGVNVISETLTTEAEYRAWAENYLHELMPDEDLTQYVYSCETSYVHNEGDASSYETYEGFYTPQENEEINRYTFEYGKNFNGYETYDVVDVTIAPYKSADEPCQVVSVGYSNHEFDNFVSVNIDKKKVNAAIEEAIRNAIEEANGELVFFEAEDEYYLVHEDGVFGILYSVAVTPKYPESIGGYTNHEIVFVSIPTSDYTIDK